MTEHAAVGERIAAVETAMHAAGMWADDPPSPAAFDFRTAFAADTMAFPQWLQFVFVPNVRHLVESQGQLPGRSMVAAQAVREFDGVPEADAVVAALSDFDALFA